MNKNLIITESSRMLNTQAKEALDAQSLSFTFLPAFVQLDKSMLLSASNPYPLDNVFPFVTNTRFITVDGVSRYFVEKIFNKEYMQRVIPFILHFYNEEGDILLAQDNDQGGNMMASLLYYLLIDNGVPHGKIKRIIGVEEVIRDNYSCLDVYMGSFYSKKLLLSLLERDRIEKQAITEFGKIDKRLKKGFRRIGALKHTLTLYYYNNGINIVSKNIALCTYLAQYAISKKEEENKGEE